MAVTNVWSILFIALAACAGTLVVDGVAHHKRHTKHQLRRGVALITNSTAVVEDDTDGDDDDDDDDDVIGEEGNASLPPLVTKINVPTDANATVPMAATGDGQGTEAAKANLQEAVVLSHEKLAENLREQVAVNAEVKELDNVEAGHRLIDASVQAVANETQSPAMASFLGDMWKEMRMFAKPFYKEHLEEKLGHLEEQNSKLQAEFTDSQKSFTAWKPNAVTTLTYSADSLAFGPGAPEPSVA